DNSGPIGAGEPLAKISGILARADEQESQVAGGGCRLQLAPAVEEDVEPFDVHIDAAVPGDDQRRFVKSEGCSRLLAVDPRPPIRSERIRNPSDLCLLQPVTLAEARRLRLGPDDQSSTGVQCQRTAPALKA